MKNKILIILLTVALVASGFLMANPITSSFDITTTVAGINEMKFTTETVSIKTDFEDSSKTWTHPSGGVVAEGEVLKVDDNFHEIAYISVMSNSRKGFTVSMTASAMKSTLSEQDAYINYAVALDTDTAGVSTSGATNASIAEVIKETSLSALKIQSKKISVKINKTEFEQAVEDSYTGTITFTYTAN